jgi:phosphoglycerate dehydrogenase-like enzyme
MTRHFQIALTGDFLDQKGALAYGDIGLRLLDGQPGISFHFLTDQAPRADDSTYWRQLYSLELKTEHIKGVNGLVVLRPWVKRALFAQGASDLVVIGRSGAGFDKVDLEACTDNDVLVFNAPQALNHPTASSALLLMLALAKRLHDQERITREGRWDLQAHVVGSELRGRTLGIIGLGHTGRELARLVAPFQMQVLAFSPHADPAIAEALGVTMTALDEVLRRADFLSLHCRLTQATRRLIGAHQLALMRPSSYLINVARGEVVDQAALVAALLNRRIAGAGLDVFEVEPLPLDDPLLSLDNVILTPHFLPATTDVWQASGQAMIAGMLRASRGEVPENVVNLLVLDRPQFRAKLARFSEGGSTA